MKCLEKLSALIVVVTIAIAIQPLSEAQSSLVKEGAKEIIEAITQRFGQAGLKEVMEKVGQESIEELLQRAISEGGEHAGKSVVKIVGEHGLQAIIVLRRAPGVFSQALESIPPNMVSQALGAIERDPALMTRVTTKLGGRAIQAELKHPGIGARIVDVMGNDGLRLADNLSTNDMKRIVPIADDLRGLSVTEKSKIIDKILSMPVAVLDYLEKHPRVLTMTGGVAVVVAIKGNVFGKTGSRVTEPDGTTTEPAPGFIERICKDSLKQLNEPIGHVIMMVGGAIVVIVLLRGGVYIWKHWRLSRIRVAAEVRTLEEERSPVDRVDQCTHCETTNVEKKS